MLDTSQLLSLATSLGVGMQILSTTLQTYTAFRQNNVEILLQKLLDSNTDLRAIGHNEDLQRYFLSAIDEVAKEANKEKIDAWKNAIIHLATDFQRFEFKDNFFRILSDLTVFDLTVLYEIYSTEFDSDIFESKLYTSLEDKGFKLDYVILALKRLASNHLVTENYMNTFTFSGIKEAPLSTFIHTKNELGMEFLKFVSDISL